MLARLKKMIRPASIASSKAVNAVSDLNGDGVVDEKDAQIAANRLRSAASDIADEAGRLGKEVARSKMMKDTATGAAIGAVIAVPIPLVGPIAGAVVGAGLGLYKNILSKSPDTPTPLREVDLHAQLLKLADLRDKGLLTDSEFEEEKRKLLKGSSASG